MLKLPLLRNDVVLVAPGPSPWGEHGVWVGRRHLAVWWPGDGPWPEGCFRNLRPWGMAFILERVRPPLLARLCGRRRRPASLMLGGVLSPSLPFWWRAAVRPCPEAAAELLFAIGPLVAVLDSASLAKAARRAIRLTGRQQAQGVFLRVVPGPDGPLVRLQRKDGRAEELPLVGELAVDEPVAVPAALPRWLWWAGYRDGVYRLTRPPSGGWALWWGQPHSGLAARSWVDDRGTVVQYRSQRRAALRAQPARRARRPRQSAAELEDTAAPSDPGSSGRGASTSG